MDDNYVDLYTYNLWSLTVSLLLKFNSLHSFSCLLNPITFLRKKKLSKISLILGLVVVYENGSAWAGGGAFPAGERAQTAE